MERKQKSFDNQNSNGGSKDSLESQTMEQRDPYKAKAGDFPVKKVSPAHGQGSDEAGGSLVPWMGNLTSPRKAEIPSEGEGDSMSSRASAVAANFKVSTNSGESGVSPSSVSIAEGIDCSTGRITGGSLPIKAVYEDKVSIG